MFEDPRLNRNKVRVPRRDNYEKRSVLSATIHPDIKRTAVSVSENLGLSVSQATTAFMVQILTPTRFKWLAQPQTVYLDS
mgnify:CR=1 FL=1